VDNQRQMRNRINALEFAMLELALYLDTHPDDQKALQMRLQMQREAAELRCQYEKCYGPWMVTKNDVEGPCWSWVKNPWPWDFQKEA